MQRLTPSVESCFDGGNGSAQDHRNLLERITQHVLEDATCALQWRESQKVAQSDCCRLTIFQRGFFPSRGPRRHSWAFLLRHVFLVDVTTCPDCGGRVKSTRGGGTRRRARVVGSGAAGLGPAGGDAGVGHAHATAALRGGAGGAIGIGPIGAGREHERNADNARSRPPSTVIARWR